MKQNMIAVENVNHPGQKTRVNAEKYQAAKTALLAVLPVNPPGLTQKEMLSAVKPVIDQTLFPKGERAGWWAKTVQLDLEAKGQIIREPATPLRWHQRALS